MSDIGKELSWDDQIENEGSDFEPVPQGTYEFMIYTMERGRFQGSDKMAACAMANLDIVVKDKDGNERHIFDSLYLNSKAEWRLSQFFTAIGQKKKGESLRPNWNSVVGSTGKVEICINEYTDKNGQRKRNNKIDKYLPQEAKGYKAGDF